MLAKCLAAAAVAVAVLTGGVDARIHNSRLASKILTEPQFNTVAKKSDACGNKDWGTAGEFDYYVLAQSWSPSFCGPHGDWPGCSNPTAWQKQNLTLHGMWPNYVSKKDGHMWPQCCESSYGSDVDPTIAKSLLPAWQTYWPNEEDPSGSDLSQSLWAHEWGKHGTCSGLDQRTFFTQAMTLEINVPTPSAITNNIGGSASLSALQSYYGMSNCGTDNSADCMAVLQCDSSQSLSGVVTCYSPSFKRIICPASVISGDLCTSSSISIGSF